MVGLTSLFEIIENANQRNRVYWTVLRNLNLSKLIHSGERLVTVKLESECLQKN